jgi:hypothetical protein
MTTRSSELPEGLNIWIARDFKFDIASGMTMASEAGSGDGMVVLCTLARKISCPRLLKSSGA